MRTPKNINETTKKIRETINDALVDVCTELVSEIFYHDSDYKSKNVTHLYDALVIRRVDDDTIRCILTADIDGITVYKSNQLRYYDLVTWMTWDTYKTFASLMMRLGWVIENNL